MVAGWAKGIGAVFKPATAGSDWRIINLMSYNLSINFYNTFLMEKFEHKLRTTIHTRSVEQIMTRSHAVFPRGREFKLSQPKIDNISTYLRKVCISTASSKSIAKTWTSQKGSWNARANTAATSMLRNGRRLKNLWGYVLISSLSCQLRNPRSTNFREYQDEENYL